MAIFRALRVSMLAAALAAAGGAFALADPPPWAHGHGHGHEHGSPTAPASRGTISGTVVGVDYASTSIMVATPRGIVPVAVTPTTSIFHGSGFASLSDLGRGSRVDIDVADVGGRLIAQIIRIH